MYKNMNPVSLGIRATLSEVVELALLGGFEGIETNLPEVAALAEGQGFRYVQSIFESAKLKIGTWRLPVNWQDDDEAFEADLVKLANYAELAKKLDATQTTTTVAAACDERPFRDNFEWHCERFRRIADVLAPHDCRLGLAFDGKTKAREGKEYEFIHSLDALAQLASGVGAPNVGLVLDSFHLYASGGAIEEISKLKSEQVVAVLVNDATEGVALEELSAEDRLMPGVTGAINAVEFVKELHKIGYEGPVTLDPSSRRARQMSREQAARKAGETIEQLWKDGGLVPVEPEPEEATASLEGQ